MSKTMLYDQGIEEPPKELEKHELTDNLLAIIDFLDGADWESEWASNNPVNQHHNVQMRFFRHHSKQSCRSGAGTRGVW